MAQIYSDPKQANEQGALPDVKTFQVNHTSWCMELDEFMNPKLNCRIGTHTGSLLDGWYWQSCLPGCLPDGEPNGPFDTEQEAIEDAQAGRTKR